ncbi:MAG: xanthine dehydrogenase family protein molybdopterin-binding subunit [Gammaproteobacteria bacterium]|nr:xanthine dehydrogenase family protein molybdopterin-binding subunit [Gammaproteobacteria bacterium]
MTQAREFKIVGTRPVRHDGAERVTGSAQFGADVSLPNTLHGQMLRSPYAHAKIVSIDTRTAEAMAGVLAVVTADDFPELRPRGVGDVARDNLAHGKVLYHGHAVAAVAATSAALADAACDAIVVSYEALVPVMDLETAMQNKVILHDDLRDGDSTEPSNIYERMEQSIGDIKAGFAEADVIVERGYSTPTVHQGYVEPTACLASFNPHGQSTVWSTTQGHFTLRDATALIAGLDPSELRVIPTEIGGGFGGKTAPYLEPIALMLSKKSGRPVKIRMTREDVFRCAGPGAGTKVRVKIGARHDGTITAMEAHLVYESGAFPAAPLGGGMRSIMSAYAVENAYIEGCSVVVNKPKVRAYRGPGAPQASFALESLLNELAVELAMDPIDIRLKNAATDGSTTIGGEFREIGFIQCLEAAKNSPHYRSTLGPNQGRAVAAGFWRNGGNVSSASVHMNANGTASVATGSADLSGTRVALAMMAAEELGIDVAKVIPHVGDTDSVGFTSVSGGSRTINATGQAVLQATQDVIAQLKQRAASGWNVTPDQVEWRDGQAFNKMRDEVLTIKEICKQAPQTGGPISSNASLNAPPGQGPCFSVHICDVEVDQETGLTKVVRYTAVQDAGTAIHPAYVEGQYQGGAVQGIGWALNEEYIYDEDGVLQNPGFLDYRVPLASDLPMIDTIIVEVPNSAHPFGVRGVGEAPIIPPLAAVASAVSDAIGAPMAHLPCSPPTVLKAVEARNAGSPKTG